jgi:Flp pilus assembly CpaE family ATPase
VYPYRVVYVGPPDRADSLVGVLADAGAAIEGRFADLAALRAGWHPSGSEPRLFAVWLQRPEDTEVVRALAETVPGSPVLALVERECDAAALFEVSRAGAAQLVSVPWDEGDLALALGVVLRQFGRAARVGRLIAVAAVPDTDASALAVNIAAEIAGHWRVDCVLAEPTARFGRLNSYLATVPRSGGSHELLTRPEPLTLTAVQQSLTPVAERLRLLPGPLTGFALHAPDPARLAKLIDLARQLTECVVLYVPNTFDAAEFDTLAAAEDVVLVGGQQVPAVYSLKQFHDQLAARRSAGARHVVLDRYDPHRGGADPRKVMDLLNVPEVWAVADDPEAWTASVNDGVPLRAAAPRSRALADLGRLITRLIGPPRVG